MRIYRISSTLDTIKKKDQEDCMTLIFFPFFKIQTIGYYNKGLILDIWKMKFSIDVQHGTVNKIYRFSDFVKVSRSFRF